MIQTPGITLRIENMFPFLLNELTSTEVAGFIALNSHALSRRQALTHDSVSQFGRVSTRGRMLRVLVVDDEQESAHSLAELVRHWGHIPRTACAGHAALRTAARQHPDVVVLLNVEMPFMDGCRVSRQLRCDFPRKDCLIIAVTDQADDECRQEYSESGIDLVLVRPANLEVLETLLLLECVHVNRSRPYAKGGGIGRGSSQFARQGAVRTLRSRIGAEIDADNTRGNRDAIGAWPC
jgi:CheY-like chemotaxis protein